MTSKVYQVYAVETTPHGFSSDWQDHRQYKIIRSYLNEEKAKEYRDFLLNKGGWSAMIKSETLFD
jgi:hypothetical protein